MKLLTEEEILFVSGGAKSSETQTGKNWADVASETLDKAWEGLKAIGALIHEFVCDEH
ncbi:hypothetical protein ACO1PK_04690 [Alishewanella sp. d11]|uniref:hypothetical protein n=1 Tax=Alishewanella sp. d11 TaxID=3414030 RepID=UPI003BF8D42B